MSGEPEPEETEPMHTVRCPVCKKKLAELRAGQGYRLKCPRCGALAKEN